MKRLTLLVRHSMLMLAFFFAACKENAPVKKETWAPIIDFFSPDTTYYPESRNFPFPDSIKFVSFENYFTNKDKKPILSDSTVIYYDNYRENGKKLCCITDTLDLFIEGIKGKKYLFTIGDYISAFQSDNNSDTNLRIRKPISIPLWGAQLNTPYPPERFKNEYEKLGARYVKIDPRFDEVSRQKWNDNDSILVETIQFDNSTDRIITAIYKDMNKNQKDSIIDQLKNIFPAIAYNEGVQTGRDGKQTKITRMSYQGVSISFTQNTENAYSFMITDYYETLKLIISNTGTRYLFRNDVNIY